MKTMQIKQTKHTPGPWQFRAIPRTGECFAVMAGFERICTLNQQNSERDANARLIAAAPELLEALNYVESAGPTECDVLDDETVAITLTGKGWNQLRDAIAKARGGINPDV